jgi:hypothetical protein
LSSRALGLRVVRLRVGIPGRWECASQYCVGHISR